MKREAKPILSDSCGCQQGKMGRVSQSWNFHKNQNSSQTNICHQPFSWALNISWLYTVIVKVFIGCQCKLELCHVHPRVNHVRVDAFYSFRERQDNFRVCVNTTREQRRGTNFSNKGILNEPSWFVCFLMFWHLFKWRPQTGQWEQQQNSHGRSLQNNSK